MTTFYREIVRQSPDEESLFYAMAIDPDMPSWEITQAALEMQDEDVDAHPVRYNQTTLVALPGDILYSREDDTTYALVLFDNDDVALYVREGAAS
jgi:hypothetical protein